MNEKRIDQQEGPTKQLEIYLFVDPLCPDCWALEPVLKKLWMEYGQYFTLRHVLTGQLDRLNGVTYKRIDRHATRTGIACDDRVLLEAPLPIPYVASLAVKAAELQGRQASIRFYVNFKKLCLFKKNNDRHEHAYPMRHRCRFRRARIYKRFIFTDRCQSVSMRFKN